jgi:hypothetical protein
MKVLQLRNPGFDPAENEECEHIVVSAKIFIVGAVSKFTIDIQDAAT